jgi:hypothetical protein
MIGRSKKRQREDISEGTLNLLRSTDGRNAAMND